MKNEQQTRQRLLDTDDPIDVAILETGRSASGSAPAGALRLQRAEPASLSIDTECASPTWLIVARQFWRWRDVSIDGRPAVCVPHRLALSAVAIPPGRHRVEWKERVPGGAAGVASSAIGLLGLLLLLKSSR